MSTISRLESIYRDLEKEHKRVMKLLGRLREQAAAKDLLPLLEELRTLLIVHFAREQLPDGFYEALGELAESRRSELDELIADHKGILSDLNQLLSHAKDSPVVDETDLLDRVNKLLEKLDSHEQKEHLFATAVLGAA